MAKKKGRSADKPAKPKSLRKRLRKAEDQLQDATTKRDRAQARVDALSIIADEIRAQLAEVEKADAAKKDKAKTSGSTGATKKPAASGKSASATVAAAKPGTAKKPAVARKSATASQSTTTSKPTAARKPAAAKARKPATARKSAAAAAKSDTATARKKPVPPKSTP